MSGQSDSVSAEAPLAHRVVRGGLWVAASSYFIVGFGFLANLALTRILAPEDFGIFSLGYFFVSLIDLRPKIGINSALGHRKETTGELVGTHLALDVTAGVATLLLSSAAIPVLGAFGYSWDVIWVVLALAAAGIFSAIQSTAWVLLDKELRFGQTSIISMIAFSLSYGPGFWLALHGGGYWSLVALVAANSLLLLIGTWWAARAGLPHIWQLRWRFDRRVAGELLRFGGIVGVSTVAVTVVGQFDNFLVGTLAGVATLGFYDRAYRIAQWPSLLVTGVVSRSAFYTYARLQNDPVRLKKTVTMTVWLITTLALPLAVGIFASAPDLVRLLYGERWLASAVFLRFLVAYSVIRPLLDDAGSLFIATGRPRLSATVAGIQGLTLVAIGTPLTLQFGALGTCVAVGIAFAIGLGLTYRYVIQAIAVRLRDTLILPAIATLVALAGYLVLVRLVDFGAWPLVFTVLGKMLFASISYVAVAFGLRPRVMAERAAYVWRLVRASGDETR